MQCHSSAEGVISEPGKESSSCNALFPLLGQIPSKNKDLVLARADDHGDPDLEAGHGVCTARPGTADAYDWNFCWKVWTRCAAARSRGPTAGTALGDTRRHRSNGRWSDGAAVAPLAIQDAAPITP